MNRDLMRAKQMEQILNYRDIPTDKRLDILNALAQIGFFPGIRRCENNAADYGKVSSEFGSTILFRSP